MSVTLGDAILYLSANPDALNRDLKQADSKIKRFAKGAKNILGTALKAGMIGAGIAIAAGVGILTKSVFEAADAGEAMAKFDATFGKAGEGLVGTLDELATATGRSRYELRESAADFGAVTKAMGFSEQGAADMSAAALEMAVDLGAFHNLPTEDVAKRIRKALTGETESMKELGVVVNQNRIKQELLNMGIKKNVNEVDEAIKAQAIFNIISRQSADAQGIAAAETGSFTGQMVALKAAWSDFMIDVGTQLLPILTPMLAKFGEFARDALPKVVMWVQDRLVPAMIRFAEFVETSVIPVVRTISEWIQNNLVPAVGTASGLFRAFADEVLPVVVSWIQDNLVPALTTLGEFIQTTVVPALTTMATWIRDELVPVLKIMWDWLEMNLLPVLGAVAEVVSAVLVKAFEAFGAIWENILQPALEGLWTWFSDLFEPVSAVSGVVETLVGWLSGLADTIGDMELPDWMLGHSPSPWEKSLRGVAEAFEKELSPQLGKFSAQLQATGGAGIGQDSRAYDYSRTTQVEQMNINNGRDEQGIMQVLRNLSRT